MNNIIELRGISKSFDGESVLDNISLEIKDKEFVTLLGPSGCGKTTTLRMIGGFETPDTGDVLFDGKRINDLPPYERHVNTVFQKYALFPHLNVYDNIAFGLRQSRVPKEEIRTRVKEMLEMVSLRGFERKNVNLLSGGQQQRVAIARALSYDPDIILADEPTGNLDRDTQKEIMDIFRALADQGKCVILVSHSPDVAEMCDERYELVKISGKNKKK